MNNIKEKRRNQIQKKSKFLEEVKELRNSLFAGNIEKNIYCFFYKVRERCSDKTNTSIKDAYPGY